MKEIKTKEEIVSAYFEYSSQFDNDIVFKEDVYLCMQEYSDQQLTEFKRKLKEEIDYYLETTDEGDFFKSLIDKIEL